MNSYEWLDYFINREDNQDIESLMWIINKLKTRVTASDIEYLFKGEMNSCGYFNKTK